MWVVQGHDREDASIVSIGADSWKRSESALTKIRRGASQASGSASRSSRALWRPSSLDPPVHFREAISPLFVLRRRSSESFCVTVAASRAFAGAAHERVPSCVCSLDCDVRVMV